MDFRRFIHTLFASPLTFALVLTFYAAIQQNQKSYQMSALGQKG
jgi:hypothetical protein